MMEPIAFGAGAGTAAGYRRAIDEAIQLIEVGLAHEAHNILRRARGMPAIKPIRRMPPPWVGGDRPGAA